MWCLPKPDRLIGPRFRRALRVPGVAAGINGLGLLGVEAGLGWPQAIGGTVVVGIGMVPRPRTLIRTSSTAVPSGVVTSPSPQIRSASVPLMRAFPESK